MKTAKKKKQQKKKLPFPYDEEAEILANIRWFRKFPLEKRFEIARVHAIDALKLRGLKAENARKSS